MCLYEKFPTRLNYLGTKLAKRDLAKRDLKILEVHNYVPFMKPTCKPGPSSSGGGGGELPPQLFFAPPPILPPPQKNY